MEEERDRRQLYRAHGVEAAAPGGLGRTAADAAAAHGASGVPDMPPGPQVNDNGEVPRSQWSRGTTRAMDGEEGGERLPPVMGPLDIVPESVGAGLATGGMNVGGGSDVGGVRVAEGSKPRKRAAPAPPPMCLACADTEEDSTRASSVDCPQKLCPAHCGQLCEFVAKQPPGTLWPHEKVLKASTFKPCRMVSHHPNHSKQRRNEAGSIPSPISKTRTTRKKVA